MTEQIFFLASKIVLFVALPTNALVAGIALGAVMTAWPYTRGWGRRLFFIAGIVLTTLGVSPAGSAAVAVLERRLQATPICAVGQAGPPVAGIIVLGGGLGSVTVEDRVEEVLNDAADRLHHAARLARTFPDAPVLVSGGQVFARDGARSEAKAMAAVLAHLGVAPDRLVLETSSRTTAENAARLAAAEADGAAPGVHLLVTSAFHMPRAVATFRAAGFAVAPAPTDWRIDDDEPFVLTSVTGNLSKVDLAAKEYLGLLAYRLASRTKELWPDPRLGPVCVASSREALGAAP